MSVSRSIDRAGVVLGKRYRLEASVGTGASASVYVASDVVLGRRVAVKILHDGLSDDDAFLRRFRAEARAAAVLNHPYVLSVYDWGEERLGSDAGTRAIPYLVTEYLGGGSLRALIAGGHLLSPSQAVQVGLQAVRGLEYAHKRGLVHRDIKPANLLFDEDARLRIADFGLARALAEAAWTEPSGALLGTVKYASPEQAQGKVLDGKSDVYSLALALIESTTGTVPFLADTAIGTLMGRIHQSVPVPDDLGDLAGILRCAGAADPAERCDATELRRLLTELSRRLDRPEALDLPGNGGVVDLNDAPDDDVTLLSARPLDATRAELPPEEPTEEIGDRARLLGTAATADAGDAAPARRASRPRRGRFSNRRAGAMDPPGHRTDLMPASAGVTGPWGAPAVDPSPPHARTDAGHEDDTALVPWPRSGAGGTSSIRDDATMVTDTPVPATAAPPDSGPAPSLESRPTDEVALPPLPIERPPRWTGRVDPADPSWNPGPAGDAAPPTEPVSANKVFNAWSVPRWTVIVLALALITGAVLGGVYWYAAVRVPTFAMPVLTGISEAEARERVRTYEWVVASETAFDEERPAGIVVRQEPAVSTEVLRGGSIRIVVSKGPPPVRVPTDLKGRTLDGARQALRAVGLDVGNVERQFDERVAIDYVLDLRKGTPAELDKGGVVDLVVSAGPSPRNVPPDLTGKPVEDVKAALRTVPLIPRIVEEYHPTAAPGTVISVDPASGTQVPRDSQVTLRVSKGPAPVLVPDVRGMNLIDAQRELGEKGLTVVGTRGFLIILPVQDTDPPANTSVPPGTGITLIFPG